MARPAPKTRLPGEKQEPPGLPAALGGWLPRGGRTSGVEESDAPIDGRPDQGERLLLVHRRAVPEAHARAAEPDGPHVQASLIQRQLATLHHGATSAKGRGARRRAGAAAVSMTSISLAPPAMTL